MLNQKRNFLYFLLISLLGGGVFLTGCESEDVDALKPNVQPKSSTNLDSLANNIAADSDFVNYMEAREQVDGATNSYLSNSTEAERQAFANDVNNEIANYENGLSVDTTIFNKSHSQVLLDNYRQKAFVISDKLHNGIYSQEFSPLSDEDKLTVINNATEISGYSPGCAQEAVELSVNIINNFCDNPGNPNSGCVRFAVIVGIAYYTICNAFFPH